jgi:glycosyltransferase involved in cell wall biosynthesis
VLNDIGKFTEIYCVKNPNIHIIAPYPIGKAPSQRFRFEQYIDFLEQHQYKVQFHAFHSEKGWELIYKKGSFIQKSLYLATCFLKRMLLCFRLINAQHIFIHREMSHLGPPIFEWILVKLLRKKYTYDFDDAIWLPNYSEVNQKYNRLKCYWKTKHLIKWADKVVVGNDFLAIYARQFNNKVQIIPTTIDTENHHQLMVNHDAEKVIIGWTGTHTTMHYLAQLYPIILELEKTHEFEFHVISNEKPSQQLASLVYKKWNKSTEIEDLAQIQIGVMPLTESDWAEGKCGFKALQYMSLGAVAVVSPVGVNSKIIQHEKNGFIVSDAEEWKKTLIRLIENGVERKQIGANAKKSIVWEWSVQKWTAEYIQLFNK